MFYFVFFFFQAEDGIRDYKVTGVQTCALPICTVVIGTGDDLFGHELTLEEVNWLAAPLGPGDPVFVQCRYRAPAVPGRVRERAEDTLSLDLAEPVRAITPGQSGALYDGDGRLLGGGVIS